MLIIPALNGGQNLGIFIQALIKGSSYFYTLIDRTKND